MPKSQLELTVELSSDEMSVYFDAAARELSRSHPVAGFRPGMAPKDAVIREVGQDKFNRLAFDLAIKDSFSKAVLDNQLEIIGDPRFVESSPDVPDIATLGNRPNNFGDNSFAYRAVVDVVPRVDVGDYRAVKVA